jgi:hypothetical protein
LNHLQLNGTGVGEKLRNFHIWFAGLRLDVTTRFRKVLGTAISRAIAFGFKLSPNKRADVSQDCNLRLRAHSGNTHHLNSSKLIPSALRNLAQIVRCTVHQQITILSPYCKQPVTILTSHTFTIIIIIIII